MNLASSMLKHPTGPLLPSLFCVDATFTERFLTCSDDTECRREKPTERFTQFNGENQAAVVRLKAWCDRVRGCTSSNGSDSRTALPHPDKQTKGAGTHKYQSIPAHFSRHFQGREGYFATIDRTFATSAKRPALVSLYGLPGIGKTQLAMRYCKSRATQYDVILWTEADTELKIQEALSKYAVNLDLPGAEARGDSALNCRILLEWLEVTGGYPYLFPCHIQSSFDL